jgi:hypothetical protein
MISFHGSQHHDRLSCDVQELTRTDSAKPEYPYLRIGVATRKHLERQGWAGSGRRDWEEPGRFSWVKGVVGAVQRVRGAGEF